MIKNAYVIEIRNGATTQWWSGDGWTENKYAAERITATFSVVPTVPTGFNCQMVEAPGFSPEQLDTLRSEWSKFERIDPCSDSYIKFIELLDNADRQILKSLALAGIKFVSMLANNRLVW